MPPPLVKDLRDSPPKLRDSLPPPPYRDRYGADKIGAQRERVVDRIKGLRASHRARDSITTGVMLRGGAVASLCLCGSVFTVGSASRFMLIVITAKCVSGVKCVKRNGSTVGKC